MENTKYLQRARSLTVESMKIDLVFMFFLLAVISHLYTSVHIEVGNMFALFALILTLGCFSVATILLGWLIVGSVLALRPDRTSRFLSGLLGLFVGAVLVLALNSLFSPSYYMDFLNAPAYLQTELAAWVAAYGFTPSITNLIILSESTMFIPGIFIAAIMGYVGWRLGRLKPSPVSVPGTGLGDQGNMAKDASYFERVRSMTVKGIKIGIKPAILSAAVFGFYDYLNIVLVDEEFSADFHMVVFISIFVALTLIFLLIGSSVLAAVLSLWKKEMPDSVSSLLGLIVGVIVALVVNRYLFINLFYGFDYDVIAYTHSYVDVITIFFPYVLEVLILIYIGWRLNRTESTPTSFARGV